ncbi:MAG: FAD-dependent oxidoreductase [Spirochaetaceae bacterium]
MSDTTIYEVRQKMQEIVDSCIGEESAYCVSACPMHTDVKGYVGLIGEGRFLEALSLIREKLFMPAILGRICAHPCEHACKRNEMGAPTAVAALKRFVADHYDDPELWDVDVAPSTGKRVAIIGAGPAGAQAAFDLVKAGHAVTVYDRLPVVGGMLAVGIPAYRLPRDIIELEYSILQRMGVKLELGVEVGSDVSLETLRREYDGVVVAVGAHKGTVLPIPGHDAKGVFNSVDFLREVALTGGFEGLGKRTVVVGGGDVAIDAARTALRLGVHEVAIVYRRSEEEMPADPEEIEDGREEGVHILTLRNPNRIDVDAEGRVVGIELAKCRLGEADASGRRRPIPIEGCDDEAVECLPADSVIFACGQKVETFCAPELAVSDRGQFVVDPLTLETELPGIVVAGDATGHSSIAIEAMAEGRKAATTLNRLFAGQDLRAGRDRERSYVSKLETDIPKDAIRTERVKSSKLPSVLRTRDFREYNMGIAPAQAIEEAGRCLNCECLKCVKECVMLQDFTSCPKTLFEEILAQPTMTTADPKIAYSCNMCSQCTLACPKSLDMQGVFGEMRKAYVTENRGKSPMKGHNVIYMHQKLGFSKTFNTTVASPDGFTRRVFIPGCALPSYNPEAVGQIYRHLNRELGNTGAILKCCGKPTKALGQQDLFKERYGQLQTEIDRLGAEEIIVACQSCYLTMKQYSPNQRVRSLWEIMPEIGLPEGARDVGFESDVTFAIHDSCSTRDVPEIHDGIRWIMTELGYAQEEPPHSRENAQCCGFGGMVVPANPDLARRVMQRRTSEVESDHMVTYCAACRESMVMGGKKALHVLDLVFGPTYHRESAFPAAGGNPVKAWANRYKAKKALEREGSKTIPQRVPVAMK